MYKHVISYRFYLDLKPGSSISPVKKLEIIVDEKIYSDGPGVWKTKCKNFISSQTGINPEQVLEDSNFGIKYIGTVSDSEDQSNKKTSKKGKSIFVPLWALPFKLIWRLIKLLFFFIK
jgi:hypothetical protein